MNEAEGNMWYNYIMAKYIMMRELRQQNSEIEEMSMDEIFALIEIHRKVKEMEFDALERVRGD